MLSKRMVYTILKILSCLDVLLGGLGWGFFVFLGGECGGEARSGISWKVLKWSYDKSF